MPGGNSPGILLFNTPLTFVGNPLCKAGHGFRLNLHNNCGGFLIEKIPNFAPLIQSAQKNLSSQKN